MELIGPWRAAVVDDELRRTGADPGLDDGHWPVVPVPGHWSAYPDVDGRDGPVLYRSRFKNRDLGCHEPEHWSQEPGKRYWLRFDGVMSGSEVWLDGRYLGDTVGYFAPHRFEITDQLRRRSEHVLAVDVSCPAGGGLDDENRTKVALTGSLQTGPLAPPGNPGGLWRPVFVDTTGPIAIRHSRLLCTGADDMRATLQIRLVMDAAASSTATLTTTVGEPAGDPTDPDRYRLLTRSQQTRDLAAGENRLEWTVDIDDPMLWWPAALGKQPLYRVEVTVTENASSGASPPVSDARAWTTGLRAVELDDFVFRCNGERQFLTTVAYGPAGPHLGDVSARQFTQDLAAARDAGFAMVRVFGHITRPEFYEEADRTGMLLWQDLPLVGGYSSKVRRAVKTTVREAVDVVGHHPSIVIWGGHLTPNGELFGLPDPDRTGLPSERNRTVRRMARHVLPNWNRSILDSIIGRELGKMDPARPVVARSGVLPSVGGPHRSDSHLWLGWRTGTARDVSRVFARWPRLASFPGGIGTQTAAPGAWPLTAPEWSTAERASFERYVPRRAYGDGESWAAATETYQCEVLRSHIETIRALRYRPSGGFCITALVDPEPTGGFGLLDTRRRAKPAYNTVTDACRPVVVLAQRLPLTMVPGQILSLDIHVDSDLRRSLDDAVVSVVVSGPDWPPELIQHHGFRGTIPGDETTMVGTVTITVPDLTGPLILDLELESHMADGGSGADDLHRVVATNRYRTVVIPAAESLTELTGRTRRRGRS